MIHLYIESFKWLLNKINQIENKNSFIIIIIRKDALLSSNDEARLMRRWRVRIVIFVFVTLTQFIGKWFKYPYYFPPDTFMVITFAGALQQALVHLNAELFSCADGTLAAAAAAAGGDTKHRRAGLDSHGSTVSCCFHQRSNFFSSLIDGCLKYTNKEKPETGLGPGLRLNYDVKICPEARP